MAPIAVTTAPAMSQGVSKHVAEVAQIEPDVVLKQLSHEEKISLLSGDDQWHTVAVPRLGVPRVRMSDGPNGVRGTAWTNGAPASCFPAATALGASFDIGLVRRIGEALGQECRARGVHCLLGPTTNIQRHPCGGRGFESYSEDPFLSGTIAQGWIDGVQSCKVMTYFVGNEQEYHRYSSNSVMDERTMHEIYLEPFRIQLKSDPKVFMSSYNLVNGLHASENPLLLRDILRGEFGFKGMVVSDWSGTYSSSEGVKAGLDLEMPGPAFMRGTSIERDIICGKLKQDEVDRCVLRTLAYVREAQASGIPFEAEESTIDTPAVRRLLREAAGAGIVLLKNEASTLPLRPSAGTKIALIGPNAKPAIYAGGGSSSLPPTYLSTPLEAIKTAAHACGASVQWAEGVNSTRWTPLLTPYIRVPGSPADSGPGVRADFFQHNPWTTSGLQPLFTKYNNSAFSYFVDGIPKTVPIRGYVSLRATFTPDRSGVWELGLGVSGQADLYIDGQKIVENSVNQKPSVLFFGKGTEERVSEIDLVAGRDYELEVRFSNFKQVNAMSPYSGRRGGIRIGGKLKGSDDDLISEAVEQARSSDATILVIGTNGEWESEGYDRADIKLPGRTDDLVRAVLAVKPDAVIVNQSGMPVELPWLAQASTVVQAFFGGNEGGTAIADALFGNNNPSGKLPITWPRVLEDYPSHQGFGHPTDTVYSEGLGVGYRYFDRPSNPASAFPFGHGLSYTSFAYSDLSITPQGRFGAQVAFTITNTGMVAGAESAQVYVHQVASPVERPEIELKAFAKATLSPGQSKRVTVELDHTAWSYYCVGKHCWLGRSGDFEVRVGSSSTAIRLVKPFHLTTSYHWTGLTEPVPTL